MLVLIEALNYTTITLNTCYFFLKILLIVYKIKNISGNIGGIIC
jgi:hypothetical protein